MSAPIGNKFWELRAKHGRDRLFASPKLLWAAAVEYFQWCEDNPLPEEDYRGKDATKVTLYKLRAFTINGLCLYLDCTPGYFSDFQRSLMGREDELSQGFSTVISRIISTIYVQKFTGAAAGMLKENLISRELGIADKVQTMNLNIELTDYVDYTTLSEEALKEIDNAAKTKRLESNG